MTLTSGGFSGGRRTALSAASGRASELRLATTDPRVPGAAGPLSPVRGAGLPVGAPDADRAPADGAGGRDRRCRSSTRCATSAAGRSAATAMHDPINGFQFLAEAYDAADPAIDGAGHRAGPVGQASSATIVNNESADILRMLSTVFAPLADASRSSCIPRALADEIDALNAAHLRDVNNGVYKAGFAGRQESTSARCRRCSRRWTSSTCGSRTGASCSAPSRWRPTGGCSRRWCDSTPSTRSTSSARSASSSSTSTCGRTRATSTSGRASPRRSTSTRSAPTTTAPTRRSTRRRIVAALPGRELRGAHGRG